MKMQDTARADTLVEQVYSQVLNLLYRRGLTGVETLNGGNLAESLGVSRTPVNLALARLEGEGLVHRSATKGWVTIPLTLEDIEEIFDLKEVLEPLTARKAAQRITPEAATELMSIVDDMEMASKTRDLEKWLTADHRYHTLLFSTARSRCLARFQVDLNNQLYRLWVGYSSMEGHMAQSCVEHRIVAEAIVAREPDLAAERASQHIHSLRSSLIDVIKNILIPFLGQEL